MALLHFCDKGNIRGVSLLMWLGANPRAAVPDEHDDSEEWWETPMAAAAWVGNLDVIKRLKPDPAKDDVNQLLHRSIFCRKMDLVRYWVLLGADKNSVSADGHTAYHEIMSNLAWALNPRDTWFLGVDGTRTTQFTFEWFASGVKWVPNSDDTGVIRQALSRLSFMEAYEMIKLLLANEVVSADELGAVLDCPKLRAHLQQRHAAIAALVPQLQKWIMPGRRKRQPNQSGSAATRRPGR